MKKKNLLMTAIAIFGLAAITMAQTIPSYVPTNGLVGWWPFNGNANDESGNGNNGTVNGAVLTTDRLGNPNSAYYFNLFDFITTPYLGVAGNAPRTISFWIKNQYGNRGVRPIMYGGGNTTYGDAFDVKINRNYQHDQCNCWPTTYEGAGLDGAHMEVIYNATIADSLNWHYYVYVVNSQVATFQDVKIYRDGLLISNSSNIAFDYNNASSSLAVNTYTSTSYPLTFGKSEANISSAGSQLDAGPAQFLDDIGFWNRALTQQEITDLYNGCQLSVNTQPTNQTVNINNNAQFVVSSSSPGVIYQWQTDLGVGFQNLNSVGQYSGTTNDTLTVSNVMMSNNNQPFRCIVSSGSCFDPSNVAVLTVNNNVGINETSQDKLFSVFPNPSQSVINVKADSKLIGEIYTIYDNTGRAVLTGKLNAQNTTIDLGILSGGIYMFSVGVNMKQTFKVIKAE